MNCLIYWFNPTKMKTLLLIRHAKSSWDDPGLKDFDRVLTDRGKKNAPVMAKRLIKRKARINLFVSSPAKRAKSTAELFMKEFGKNKRELLLVPQLYNAGEEDFYTVISGLDDEYVHVAVFSHNPGITDFANELTGVRVDNIPTCGIFAISIETEKWNQFRNMKKEFLFFDYPKSTEDK